jgi:hypothetical protein
MAPASNVPIPTESSPATPPSEIVAQSAARSVTENKLPIARAKTNQTAANTTERAELPACSDFIAEPQTKQLQKTTAEVLSRS